MNRSSLKPTGHKLKITAWLSLAVLLGVGLCLWRWTRPAANPGSDPAWPSQEARSEPQSVQQPRGPGGRSAPGSAVQPSFSSSLLRRLAASLETIQREPDSDVQDEKLQALAEGVPEAELPGALALLREQGNNELHREFGLRLLRRWAATAAPAADRWTESLPAGPARQEAVRAVATVWASQNVAAAAQWARQLPEEPDRAAAVTGVAYEAARTEPLLALNLATQLPAAAGRDELILHTAGQWSASDPQAAAQWAGQIGDPLLRERVVAVVATVWGETDPAAAATLAIESLPPGKAQDDALVSIVQRWAQKEPEAAAAWVAQFPPGPVREAAVANLGALWPFELLEPADGGEPAPPQNAEPAPATR